MIDRLTVRNQLSTRTGDHDGNVWVKQLNELQIEKKSQDKNRQSCKDVRNMETVFSWQFSRCRRRPGLLKLPIDRRATPHTYHCVREFTHL